MSYTVCLTCVGGEMSPQMIRFLQAAESGPYRVVGVDMDREASGGFFADAFETVPAGTDPGYVSAMLDIAQRHGCDLVVPCSDEEALALSAAKAAFQDEGIAVAVNDPETVRLLTDKAAFMRRLESLGYDLVDWTAVSGHDALQVAVDRFVDRWGGAVVKPVQERGGRGVTVIRGDVVSAGEGAREHRLSPDSFRAQIQDLYPTDIALLVMRPLLEPVLDVDMLSWHGEPLSLVPRKRRSSALPNLGHTLIRHEEALALAERLVRDLSLSWLLDLDLMETPEGGLGILEINPRPSGSSVVPMAAGVPLFADMIELARGRDVPKRDFPAGVHVMPFKAVAAR